MIATGWNWLLSRIGLIAALARQNDITIVSDAYIYDIYLSYPDMAFNYLALATVENNAGFSHPGVAIDITDVMRRVGPELAIMDCRSCRWFRSILVPALPEKRAGHPSRPANAGVHG